MNVFLTVASVILLNQAFASTNEFELEQLQVLFRHGDRTPDKGEIYKTDPYDGKYGDLGYGQLTKIGMQRAYRVGTMLRERYNYFLGKFRSDEVYGYSTDYDRTKSSLALALAGLYPPIFSTTWSDSVNWTPIPTHYKEKELNFLQTAFNCKEYENQFLKVEFLPEVRTKFAPYAEFYEDIKKKTGMEGPRIFSSTILYCNLRCALSYGFPLPSWCSKEDYKKLSEMASILFTSLTQTKEMTKIITGSMLEEFLSNIYSQEHNKDKTKVYLYAGHDYNVAAFTQAHNFTGIPVNHDFGSAVIIEKLRGKDNKIYLRMFLWTGVSETLIPLKLEKCDYECLLSDYIKIIEPILPGNDYGCTATVRDSCSKTLRGARGGAAKINIQFERAFLFAGEDSFSLKYGHELFTSV